MDKNAAHYANIALHMYEHNNYWNLVDRGYDYFDKPHFLFWTSALSFKVFGINSFAHRLPALIFSLLSIYSTYKLTCHLSNRSTGMIAAMMVSTAQAFVLSVTDARMETPLTAAIIFGIWQLIMYIDTRRFIHLLLAALGSAIAFSTKGWIGPLVIFITVFFYIGLQRKWNVLSTLKTWFYVPLFFLFISPVLYAYYVQYDLHPEKIIRGQGNRSGIYFILWGQLFERWQGFDERSTGRNTDYFFLYHTFLWAFFPWCIISCVAIMYWFRRIFYYKKWSNTFSFASLSFVFTLFVISFSNFKMPHYIIMLLPLAAIFTAPYLHMALSFRKSIRFYFPLQVCCVVLYILLTIVLNYYFFPPRNVFIMVIGSALVIGLMALIFKRTSNKAMKTLYLTTASSLVFNFFMNYNFFPSLLKYQGGNELVKKMHREQINIPDEEIILLEPNAHSFDFYRKHNHPLIEIDNFDSAWVKLSDKYFLLSTAHISKLKSYGFYIKPAASHVDYNITTPNIKFINPSSRVATLDTLLLARIYKQ